MSASQHDGGLGAAGAEGPSPEGLPPHSNRVRFDFFRPGWLQPVGWTKNPPGEPELIEDRLCTYLQIELEDFYLSHAASLYLLQGASLMQVFSDVVVKVGDKEPEIYSIVFATPPRLHLPPPRIERVVLAHILERPANWSPEELLQHLFKKTMAYASHAKFLPPGSSR